MKALAVVSIALVLAVLVVAARPDAQTCRVPIEQKDLTQALREARYGDTVLVYPGKYHLQSKVKSGVKLLSARGPDSTILWNKRWYIVRLEDCDLETRVSGFTFDGKGCNIAVACTSGAPSIVGNVIRASWDGISLEGSNAFVKGNTVEGCNRGIAVTQANPELVENTITRNGEGIYLFSSSPVIARCSIVKNSRAIFLAGYSYPTVGGSLSAANDIFDNGYALYNEGRRIEGSLYTDQREVAVATYNYWGSLCPDKGKFRGDVVYTPWANAEHDSVYRECPAAAPAAPAGPGGSQ